jgi:hypothetical protein
MISLPPGFNLVLDEVGPAIAVNWPQGLCTYDASSVPLFPVRLVAMSATDYLFRTDPEIPNALVQPVAELLSRYRASGKLPVALHLRDITAEERLTFLCHPGPRFMLCVASTNDWQLSRIIRSLSRRMDSLAAISD